MLSGANNYFVCVRGRLKWNTFYRVMLWRARLCHSMSSVCPSLRDVQVPRSHIWNTSQIIPRLISVRQMLGLTTTSAIWSNGNTNTRKIIGLWSWAQKSAVSLKQCKLALKLLWVLWRTNRKSHWYQNQWPWMTLNGRNVTLAEINSFMEGAAITGR